MKLNFTAFQRETLVVLLVSLRPIQTIGELTRTLTMSSLLENSIIYSITLLSLFAIRNIFPTNNNNIATAQSKRLLFHHPTPLLSLGYLPFLSITNFSF